MNPVTKKIIITGDDFGANLSVNEAIEEAHRQGVLTTASLMVGAEASADAIDRAKRLPTLRLGLHLVMVDGTPVSPPHAIPDLVDGQGHFSSHLVRTGFRFFFSSRLRQQLEIEIRAQFQAYKKTGLPFDHVNTHHHMHLHPSLLGIILKVGKEFGMKAMRLPREPFLPSWHASREGLLQRLTTGLLLWPWITLLENRLRDAQVSSNDIIFGMNDSGDMNEDRVCRILGHLPKGVTEIYFHPAGRQVELEALTSPLVREALLASGAQRISFSDL